MLGQVKNNKGFNLLELIVVIAIVGFISAISYPNFSSWNKERKTRAAVKEVEAMIRNAIVQTERGTFAYVQVLFSNTANHLKIESRGMTLASLITRMNNGESPWNKEKNKRCKTDAGDFEEDNNYWDTDNKSTSNEIKNAVYAIELKDVSTNFFGERAAAVCFAKNGKFYEGSASLAFDASTGVPFNFINICRRESFNPVCGIAMPSDVDGDICPEKPVNSEGKVIDDGEVTVSRVHWNRFGNVVTSRYVNEYEIDPGTGDKKWACDDEAPKYVYD
jgi:prepilin-type N-terminal cleavage/methylation domain-containing protein|tara:strand:- start:6509 stop:7336 length:828 start_codon:yes stop_codon:yes gene_type:complete